MGGFVRVKCPIAEAVMQENEKDVHVVYRFI